MRSGSSPSKSGFKFLLNDYLSTGQRSTSRASLAEANKARIGLNFHDKGMACHLTSRRTHVGFITPVRQRDSAYIQDFHSDLLVLAHELKAGVKDDKRLGEKNRRRWAWVESNYRPHAYQACALTN